jgi:hypothetical protein
VQNRYVILTGSKNNAGDFLIKDRAKHLLAWLRPDRELIDKDAWKPFDERTLNEVNKSRALILMGGPALQEKMRPRVYGLVENLDDIKVPIITMGIGWYSASGRWEDTHTYPLNQSSLELLLRIDKSGFMSSVRDYHTLNVLHAHGFKNYLMTGCPALYCQDHIDIPIKYQPELRQVVFSLGVSLRSSQRMFRQMQDVVLRLRDSITPANLVVAFHHGLGQNYLNSPGASKLLYIAQQKFSSWLDVEGIAYEDISGSAERLKSFYSGFDLHVGYRVHAHIFMSSISKPSILINEDGRGKALEKVLGGVVFDSYESVNNSNLVKALHKFCLNYDNFRPAVSLARNLAQLIPYELKHGVRLALPKQSINQHFGVMRQFIRQLP